MPLAHPRLFGVDLPPQALAPDSDLGPALRYLVACLERGSHHDELAHLGRTFLERQEVLDPKTHAILSGNPLESDPDRLRRWVHVQMQQYLGSDPVAKEALDCELPLEWVPSHLEPLLEGYKDQNLLLSGRFAEASSLDPIDDVTLRIQGARTSVMSFDLLGDPSIRLEACRSQYLRLHGVLKEFSPDGETQFGRLNVFGQIGVLRGVQADDVYFFHEAQLGAGELSAREIRVQNLTLGRGPLKFTTNSLIIDGSIGSSVRGGRLVVKGAGPSISRAWFSESSRLNDDISLAFDTIANPVEIDARKLSARQISQLYVLGYRVNYVPTFGNGRLAQLFNTLHARYNHSQWRPAVVAGWHGDVWEDPVAECRVLLPAHQVSVAG